MKPASIIDVLEEQLTLNFNGRINVLKKKNKQLIGHVLLHEGEVIDSQYLAFRGLKSLYYMAVKEWEKDEAEYVVEPEITKLNSSEAKYDYRDIAGKLKVYVKDYKNSLNLRPDPKLKLIIRDQFIKEGSEISPEEFDLICVISEFNRVEDIYRESHLLDHEITLALVSLRKKGALKVLL